MRKVLARLVLAVSLVLPVTVATVATASPASASWSCTEWDGWTECYDYPDPEPFPWWEFDRWCWDPLACSPCYPCWA